MQCFTYVNYNHAFLLPSEFCTESFPEPYLCDSNLGFPVLFWNHEWGDFYIFKVGSWLISNVYLYISWYHDTCHSDVIMACDRHWIGPKSHRGRIGTGNQDSTFDTDTSQLKDDPKFNSDSKHGKLSNRIQRGQLFVSEAYWREII